MALRPIIEAPDPRLRQISAPVTAFDAELARLVEDMFETMYAAPGIGLAAVQIGVPLRVIVIDLQERVVNTDQDDAGQHDEHASTEHTCDDDACGHDHGPVIKTPRVFINPVLSNPSEDSAIYQEGCLSVPEIYAEVERPAKVHVRWQDLDGAHHEEMLEGLLATCIQHEIDHLEGVLFIDHLSRLKRGMALKKLEKARKAA